MATKFIAIFMVTSSTYTFHTFVEMRDKGDITNCLVMMMISWCVIFCLFLFWLVYVSLSSGFGFILFACIFFCSLKYKYNIIERERERARDWFDWINLILTIHFLFLLSCVNFSLIDAFLICLFAYKAVCSREKKELCNNIDMVEAMRFPQYN